MTFPHFEEFFEAIHGVSPLPWQSRLAERLLVGQGWPESIDLPTASGKTACIDIAIFHLAVCADRKEPWKAFRRIAFVVDRRIIVDAAYERACKISASLREPSHPAIRRVAAALTELGGEDVPLMCQKLRGGMPRERNFALNPAQPMVITSTVDQVGSRLLFRGYGLRPYSQPLHAGLLSHDTLILLDEAHLGLPFMDTVKAIRREQARAEQLLSPIQPVRLVPLSATLHSGSERFTLSETDFANELLKRRRTAPKPARLVTTSAKQGEHLKTLTQVSLDLYQALGPPAPALAVIVNRVKTARALFDELTKTAPENCDVTLLIGRNRPLSADQIAKEISVRVSADRVASPDDRGLLVVATQTIEVGADLDFQGLVTECASVDALRQRFGRLDRLGNFRRSCAAILGGADVDDDPIYGTALNETWRWLRKIATRKDDGSTVDFGIEAMEAALQATDIRPLLCTPPEQLCLTPNHVQLLCQTAPSPMYVPDVGALLHGLKAEQPEVQVVWRADIPPTEASDSWTLEERRRFAAELLDLLPPTTLEGLSLPIAAAKTWLIERRSSVELSDLEGPDVDDEEPKRAARERVPRVWRKTDAGCEAAFATELRPGDIVVLPSQFGGCDKFGFSPAGGAAVDDLTEQARAELRREQIVLVTKEFLKCTAGSDLADVAAASWEEIEKIHRSMQQSAEDLWSLLLENAQIAARLDEAGLAAPGNVELLNLPDGTLYALILRSGKLDREDLSDEDDSASLTVRNFTKPIFLDDHNRNVGQRARRLALSVGLPRDLVDALECSGNCHDLGKGDPRFQRFLRGPDNVTSLGALLAKGLRRKHLRVELGERHEAYSVAMLKVFPALLKSAPDRDLALYLVGSHHGRGRALMPFRQDTGAQFTVKAANGEALEFDGTPSLGELNSGWAELFWKLVRRYGPWGLAYLESILRLADHLQSRDEMKDR